MKLGHKIYIMCFGLVIGLFLVTGCSSSSQTNQGEEDKNTKEMVLKDSLGNEVDVPTHPKRIIASYLEDYLIALDTKPVAQWTVKGGTVQDYLQKELKGIPTISYDLPYEEVLSYDPDLLLISSSATVEGGKYAEYAKIAPTYVVKNGEDVTWQEQLHDVAKVLSKEDVAKEVIANYTKIADETAQEIQDKIDNPSVAVLWITNNQAFMVSEHRSSGALLYHDLKMKVPNVVEEISAEATADWSNISLEKLAQLDANYIFLINSDKEASLFEEEIWKNIPAVKNQHVFEYGGDSSWLYNGPIANKMMIEEVRKSLLSSN